MSKEAKRKKSPKCVCHLMWHLRKPESATPPHTPPQPSEPISSLSPCPPPTAHRAPGHVAFIILDQRIDIDWLHFILKLVQISRV